ncbi:MAG: dihydroneopterin aldolase [Flavobacteriales bacterium]|nr:MAG: dihydroneopterin aldolase [Flavobacteriales bacterium]
MESKIILEDIKIYAYHGVLPEENKIGAYYFVNIEISTDLEKASQTDALEDTISYADINDIIHEEMAIPSKLLEHIAGRIIRKLYQKFNQITKIKIKITKTAPPMKGEMKGASVELIV